ncbi:MAG: hypothetical protein FJ295_18975 [Planctomycetes bacterium]|nr:hypothetical protein [Planctomycetota bacterium]
MDRCHLFSTLQIANNALNAQQLGLQVSSNNIANANMPGYVREQVQSSPAPTSRHGNLLVGLGVEVNAIIQKTDRFLEERLRVADADVAYSESQETIYSEIETLIGELENTDISSSMTRFFNLIHDVLNQPESLSTRNVAIQQGIALTNDIRRLDQRTREVRRDVNQRVVQSVTTVNELTRQIAGRCSNVDRWPGRDDYFRSKAAIEQRGGESRRGSGACDYLPDRLRRRRNGRRPLESSESLTRQRRDRGDQCRGERY